MPTKKELIWSFQLHGMHLRGDAASYLSELLEPLPREEHKKWVEAVVDAMYKIPLASNEITREAIHKAAQEVGNEENDELDNILEVIDIYKIPRLIYNEARGKFTLESTVAHNLHGQAADKTALFMNRYSMIYSRTSNHELFRQQAMTRKDPSVTYSLTKVVSLVGTSQQIKVLVLGLLTKLVEGKYHLEDDTGNVEVDLTNAHFKDGLFTVNSILLVEGWFDNNVLHAEAIGMPPPEPAKVSRERMGLNNENYFGGSRRKSVKATERLMQLEQNPEAMFVVLSDVWLDVIEVMEKLQVMFTGYANFPPVAFILCGNFFSKRRVSKQMSEVRKAFGALGSLIAGFPNLVENTKFIFVPGPTDLGPSGIFPRPPILQYATELLRKAVPSACFATNPCRLVYCTQEIVILREDMVARMCRNCVHFPQDGDVPAHVGKTMVNQGHLAPLSLFAMPVYWALDHCLMLHPTPDVIIVADKDSFTTSYNEANIFSPGSFVSSDFSFKVYYPATRQVEESQIREEER
ncbi:hypothetical protein O3P69_015801 [Scylla paramamosain]|uniref:DNA polymerase epsilon subunit n=1 Tax=Scylla paramamosain TaxID=85552 RepID=A0AAW0T878_SCYPA